MPGFTHLHCHSEYSLLDGLARVPDLVATAKERGFDALALTDHGVMFGAVQFYEQATKAGIKPILGCEIYVAKRGRGDRDSRIDRKPYHLTILAENDLGYRNLMALISHAQLEGFYYRPRADRELLERYNEGLVVFSGCPGSEVCSAIIDGRMDDAREAVAWYSEVFAGRYYIELMVHDIEFIPRLNEGLLELAREFGLPTVATNDVHYCRDNDVNAHEVLLCVQTGKTMQDPDRMRIGETFYLRSEEEMRRLFGGMEAAVDRTAEVAERCNVELRFNEYKLPKFAVPAGETAATFLRKKCEQGIAERYETITEEVRVRLDYELGIIGQMGFDDYFLIVWDLCKFAAERGIWWNVRGSGAGSIVAYSLRITNIDPLHHKLIFERFLNPSRVSMPDIDLDFPDDQRDLLIRYTFETYGHDKVAQIITFGTMGARASVRDAGRALAMPLAEVDRIARMIPAIPGKSCSIQDALRHSHSGEVNEFFSHDLAAAYEHDPQARNLLDTAQRIEGVARHASTHAAGVVITDRPLVDYVPLHRPTKGGGDEDDISTTLAVTQYNMNDVEKLGLLKVDFLGLATLTVLRRAAELVERYHGKKYTLDNIPLDDPAIYELLSSGHCTGVFQVEGAGMRRMLREMRPQRFENVVAAIALYRPGPMEYIPSYIRRLHGDEKITYRHASLEPILDETYGIIVYQEQIIQIARDLAGYDAGEADLVRKAVAKKIKEKLLEHRKRFVTGAVEHGVPRSAAEGIFEDIETFARYGFNKAHAADYAVIVCQTAYLKALYPVEYMAALLSVERDDTEKIAMVAADCHRMGIALLQPDLNHSEADFTIEALDQEAAEEGGVSHQRGIRFGMAAIKNVGAGHVETIIAAREEEDPFADLEDLARRVDLRAVGKRALESLIKAGALDRFGGRATLMAALDRIMSLSTTHHRAAEVGQMSLFGDAMPASTASLLYPLEEVVGNPKEELLWEKELIGLYLSDHPLRRAADSLGAIVTLHTGDLGPDLNGQPAIMAGIVTSVRTITTKKGDPMAFVRLEDLQGDLELIVFPRTYEQTRGVWGVDRVVVVQGKVEQRDDRIQLLVDRAEPHDPEHPGAIAAQAASQTAGRDGPPPPEEAPPAYVTEATLPFAESSHETPPDWAITPAAPVELPAPTPSSAPEANGATATSDATEATGANGTTGATGAAEASDEATEGARAVTPREAPGRSNGWAGQPDAPTARRTRDADPTAAPPAPPPIPLAGPPDDAVKADVPAAAPARIEARVPEKAPSTPEQERAPAEHAAESAPITEGPGEAPVADAPVHAAQPADDLALETHPSNEAAPQAPPTPDAGLPSGGAVLREGPDAPHYRLAVTLPRVESHDEAIALLGHVFQTLTAYDGGDRFSLLVPNGPELVELEFPNHATRYCVDLLGKLKGMVGEERIKVRATTA